MMREGKFLTFLRIRFQEQVYEVRKKMEIKRLKSRFGQKNCKIFFLSTRSCARGGEKIV